MDIAEWRKKIDEIDQRLVELLSERAKAAHEIGRLKRDAGMPIYEPDRERAVLDHIAQANPGPLPEVDIRKIYRSIMEIMRKIQREEMDPESINAQAAAASQDPETDPDSNR